MIDTTFSYVQARIQSRFGELPVQLDWQRLAQASDYGHYLQLANETRLAPFLIHLGLESDNHATETALRQSFRQHVAEVSDWSPTPWQSAVTWFALLADLEAISILGRDTEIPNWMNADPFIRHLLQDEKGDYASLLSIEDGQVASAWTEVWRGRWGPMSLYATRGMARLASTVPFACFDAELEASLIALFRTYSGQPVAVFSYLGLVLLYLMRLRGELLQRRIRLRAGG